MRAINARANQEAKNVSISLGSFQQRFHPSVYSVYEFE
jgi:hypothetical protein